MRVSLLLAGVMVFVACTPPCEPTTTLLAEVCHRSSDGGAIAADASFVLEGVPGNYGTTCEVTVTDGGILLEVTGTLACNPSSAPGLRKAPGPVACTIPPLAAGTYRVIAEPELTLTVPGGGGVPQCL